MKFARIYERDGDQVLAYLWEGTSRELPYRVQLHFMGEGLFFELGLQFTNYEKAVNAFADLQEDKLFRVREETIREFTGEGATS